jgi:hypothetical protein
MGALSSPDKVREGEALVVKVIAIMKQAQGFPVMSDFDFSQTATSYFLQQGPTPTSYHNSDILSVCIYHTYIHSYIHREKEREKERDKHTHKHTHTHTQHH